MNAGHFEHLFHKPVPQKTKAELFGLVQGVLADGQIVEAEAAVIQDWIRRNDSVRHMWPASVLFDRITAMLADGVLDQEEQRELLRLLAEYMDRQAAGVIDAPKPVEVTIKPLTLDSPFDDPAPSVIHEGRRFLLTGDFAIGSRPQVTRLITERGGDICSAPSKKVHYVLVGALGSELWKGPNWGTKIERAIELRSEGAGLRIVREQHWAATLVPGG